jgi:GTPase-associated protein 1, N-terminal domain type 1
MEISEIRIDQALFGYREGHRLLQASRKFAPTTERSLLTLTDMSGPRMVDGFEEYLSGYPVPDDQTYAFVKTWYAPEMERPGCVWSHALILQKKDVGSIPELRNLTTLFKRPMSSDPNYLDYYLRSTIFEVAALPEKTPHLSLADAAAILLALYGQEEEKPVVLPSPDSTSLEKLTLETWSQQWPALRVAFRFCTGSLSSRSYAGETFDLQVVPLKLVPELRRNPSSYVFQNIPAPQKGLPPATPWIEAGAADLAGMSTEFRRFAWRYADPCGGGRSLYSKLGDLYSHLRRDVSQSLQWEGPDVVHHVAEVFPEPSCGKALKEELFGSVTHGMFDGSERGEELRLKEVAKTGDWRSFDARDLKLRERGRDFWRNEPTRRKTLLLELLESSTNPLGDEVIAGCVDVIEVAEACEIAKERNGLLVALVARNPRLVLSREFWRCPISVQTYYSVLDSLTTAGEGAIPASEWLPFLLESSSDELAVAVAERLPKELIRIVLDRELTDRAESLMVTPGWRSALAKHQNELLSFLETEEYRTSAQALTFLAGLLDPHREKLRDYGLTPWLWLLTEAADLVLAVPNAEAAAFLLSLGFQNWESGAVGLAGACFEHVHGAARNDALDRLSYRGWKSLEPDVPVLSSSWNWDNCERLRRALLERFIYRGWPRTQFLRCVNRPATLQSVFYSCRHVAGGEDFILGIAADVLAGSLSATEPQQSTFRGAFYWSRRGRLKMDL